MRRTIVLFLLAVSLLVAACTNVAPVTNPVGNASLMVVASLPAHLAHDGAQVKLVLRQDSRELVFDVPYDGEAASIEISSLYEGEWEAILQIIDAEGYTAYQAKEKLLLQSEQTTVAELRLVPAPGLLEVYIDLATFQDNHLVGRARVQIAPSSYSSQIREADANVIRIEREMEPKTYDFRVVLYGDEYSNPVYSSPWQPVTISPGRVTTVVWRVSTGDLQVVGRVFPTPGAPENLSYAPGDDGVLRFTWTPGPMGEYAVGYRIYERSGPFAYYRLIDEVPAGTFEWYLDASSIKSPQVRSYAVVAVSELGFESPRSEAVTVHFPVDW